MPGLIPNFSVDFGTEEPNIQDVFSQFLMGKGGLPTPDPGRVNPNSALDQMFGNPLLDAPKEEETNPIIKQLLYEVNIADELKDREKRTREKRDQITEELRTGSRSKYRDEAINKFVQSKGKLGKFLLGLGEFGAGLSGGPGQIAKMQMLANQDYDSDRKDKHEALMALNQDFGQINSNRKQQLDQLKYNAQNLIASRRLDLDSEYKKGMLELQKAKNLNQFGLNTDQMQTNAVNRMLKFAQIDNLAKGKDPKTPTELAYYLFNQGKLDTDGLKKFLMREKAGKQPYWKRGFKDEDGNFVEEGGPGTMPTKGSPDSPRTEDDDDTDRIFGKKK